MAKRKKTENFESNVESKIQNAENSEPKVEKKIEPKAEPKFVDDEKPTDNVVLLRNRYDKAMIEVKEVLTSKEKLNKFLSQKVFRFKFVGVGGSYRFINNGKFVIADMSNPYVETTDKEVALSLLESEKFKIIK